VQGHDVADPDPAGGERPGHQTDLVDQLAVGRLGAGCPVHDRDPIQILGRDSGEQVVEDAQVRNLDIGQRTGENHVNLL
jgi:hypothetical protein